MQNYTECLIIGAGASGLFCGAELALHGRKVLILEQGKRAGRKILISGGGYCNFTNLNLTSANYICENPHFVKSAIARFTPTDFITRLQSKGIEFYEKEHGQLFCSLGAKQILQMLEQNCLSHGVQIKLNQKVLRIGAEANGYWVETAETRWYCQRLIVATGGLSMPKLGVSPLGYQIAEQFGIKIIPPRAGLVPMRWQENQKIFAELAGLSLPVEVTAVNGQEFSLPLLFTHRGLSGPAILQISNYWQISEEIRINFLPQLNLQDLIDQARQINSKIQLKTLLERYLPCRFVELWLKDFNLTFHLANVSKQMVSQLEENLQNFKFIPSSTEGYRTAEVTLGGVDTNFISSQTMECKHQPKLYFIGEVLDVTGWLGGYNFHWAWSSAYACSEAIKNNFI